MRVRNYSLGVRPFRQGQESRLALAGGIVTDSSRQANGIDRMKEQFGYSDGVEFWKARIAKKDE